MASSSDDNTKGAFDKLDESNYSVWKFRMRMMLEEKDLWDVVEGTEDVPTTGDAEEVKKYKKKERKSLALIALSVSNSQVNYVSGCQTGKEAWEKLQEVHESKMMANKLYLFTQF